MAGGAHAGRERARGPPADGGERGCLFVVWCGRRRRVSVRVAAGQVRKAMSEGDVEQIETDRPASDWMTGVLLD